MADLITTIAAALVSYLIGAIPTGFIVTKFFKGVDIRELGSSNVGATNVFRTTGKLPGVLTLVFDILKGVIVVTVVCDFAYSFTENLDYEFFRSFLGLTVICGHIWPVFLKFRGGKGVATTIGVMGIIAPLVLALSLGAWLAVFIPTNYVSLASLALGLSLPICAAFLNKSIYVVLLAVVICGLNTYKHKDNIKRLLKREERKTVIFKSNR
ncbi:MAG: glycerol-3-phosphate 1-O-acyltransferase PlsY [Candidatus Omnitrophica bacterium]|nr:glycerol-3-phosphate 1-O-acyltransferase PlsY [Candidatus Omnitrophota bacterium]